MTMALEGIMSHGKKEKEPEELETIDEILEHYQSHHRATGKTFEERIKKIEQWTDPENTHEVQLRQEAEYIATGKPGDDSTPGAYNVAHKVLNKHVKKPNEKLDDEDKIREILESYVDSFLEKAMGKRFTERIKRAKEDGATDDDIRGLKGQLFQSYHINEQGRPAVENILEESYIKKLKGKNRVKLIERLQKLRDTTIKGFGNYITLKATEGIVNEDDILESSEYIGDKMKEAGLKPDKAMHLKNVGEQIGEYSLLLGNAVDELLKKGYKKIKKD